LRVQRRDRHSAAYATAAAPLLDLARVDGEAIPGGDARSAWQRASFRMQNLARHMLIDTQFDRVRLCRTRLVTADADRDEQRRTHPKKQRRERLTDALHGNIGQGEEMRLIGTHASALELDNVD
jgi:hypothetical protein